MPIKTAVIGVGYLGQHHARIYAEMDGVELVAVTDTDTNRAQEIAAKHSTTAYVDYKEILDKVQAVSIVTPTSTHFDVAMDCLRAGLDVLVEKPITVTVDEADALINEAKKQDCILQVGHLERYNPAVVALEPLIKNPRFIETERVSPFLGRATDVDVTHDLMIHDIDIITGLLGGSGVTDIKVAGAQVLSDKIDMARAWISFECGTTALLTASRIARDTRRRLKVYQGGSFILLDYQSREITRHTGAEDGLATETVPVVDCEPLKEEIMDFAHCVVNRQKPKVSGAEGREALKIVIQVSEMIRDAQDGN